MKVEMQGFDDLSENEKASASDNGSGKEYATYLRVTHEGKTIALESDAMEPEDARLYRDLEWVSQLVMSAYELGLSKRANQ